jgi:beta-glucosidase
MAHNVLKAHGAAVIAMRKSAKQPIKIGYAPTCVGYYPASEKQEDIEAARKTLFKSLHLSKAVLMDVTWWSDPVVLGKYPEEGLKLYKDYLPEITEDDLRLINQPIDFYAQNIYQGREVKSGENGEPIINEKSSDLPLTAMGWQITPKCLYWGARFLTERYKLPFYITENGIGFSGEKEENGIVLDDERIKYLMGSFSSLDKLKKEGIKVNGYYLWSLMDNFEWTGGYDIKYGIHTIDRKPKKSALFYKEKIEKELKK